MKMYLTILMFFICGFFTKGQEAKDIIYKSFTINKMKGTEAISHLTIKDSKGRKRERKITMATKIYDNGKTEKKIMRFIEPPEIKGTSMLTFDYNEGDDDMWIYMPALRKTRRIVSNEKSKSFMGSEFSNADMVIPNINDFNYQMISKNELIEDVECWNIIMKPKNEEIANNYGYSKRKVWIGKKDFVIRKGEVYDLSDELLKTMNVKKVELIDPKNKKYQNTIMEIYNEQNGRSSIFEIEKIIYNPNVKDIYFTTKYLEN